MKKGRDARKILKKYQRNNFITGLVIVLVLLIIAVLGYLVVINSGEMTQDKFLDKANNCKPAIMDKEIGTITMELKINDDCSITKTVIDVLDTEPEAIQDLFLGASMTCTYDKGMFDEDYVNQISGNLGYCSGSLVDAVLAVI